MIIDLNSDLGEGEAPARTRALLRLVTSANIACGGHAGDTRSMEFCVQEALTQGGHIPASPSETPLAGLRVRLIVPSSPNSSCRRSEPSK
jgi:UPF0271 protein